MVMSVQQLLKNQLKELGFKESAKAIKNDSLIKFSIPKLIDSFGLDILSGVAKEDLIDDAEETFRNFRELVLTDKKPFVVLDSSSSNGLTRQTTIRNINTFCLNDKTNLPLVLDYLNGDALLAKLLNEQKVKIVCIHSAELNWFILIRVHKPIPTMEQINQYIAMSKIENPSKEQIQKASDLYHTIQDGFKDNLAFLDKLESAMSAYSLIDEQSQQMTKLINILRVGFAN